MKASVRHCTEQSSQAAWLTLQRLDRGVDTVEGGLTAHGAIRAGRSVVREGAVVVSAVAAEGTLGGIGTEGSAVDVELRTNTSAFVLCDTDNEERTLENWSVMVST